MHPFHDYLADHLDLLLRSHSVVVFYDPRNEFTPLFDAELQAKSAEALSRVTLGGRAVLIAR